VVSPIHRMANIYLIKLTGFVPVSHTFFYAKHGAARPPHPPFSPPHISIDYGEMMKKENPRKIPRVIKSVNKYSIVSQGQSRQAYSYVNNLLIL
jgi:hypothetical protein